MLRLTPCNWSPCVYVVERDLTVHLVIQAIGFDTTLFYVKHVAIEQRTIHSFITKSSFFLC